MEYAIAILGVVLSYRIASWAPLIVGIGFIGLINRHRMNVVMLRFLVVASAASVIALQISVAAPAPAVPVLTIAIAATLTTLISTIVYLIRPRAFARHE